MSLATGPSLLGTLTTLHQPRELNENPVCPVCRSYMLAGVRGLEPAWFCPSHPDAEPLFVKKCPHCEGRGWVDPR